MGKDRNVMLHKERGAKLWEVLKMTNYSCHDVWKSLVILYGVCYTESNTEHKASE